MSVFKKADPIVKHSRKKLYKVPSYYDFDYSGPKFTQRTLRARKRGAIKNSTVKMPIKPANTAVISADYDGCWDIMFDDITELYENMRPMGSIDDKRKELTDQIEKIEEEHSKIVFIVGSSRQTPGKDAFVRNVMNRPRYKYGVRFTGQENLCFPNFAKLCKERGWEFRQEIQMEPTYKKDKTKALLVEAQIEEMKKEYDKFDFFFFDNEEKIINSVNEIVDGRNWVHIIKYDW